VGTPESQAGVLGVVIVSILCSVGAAGDNRAGGGVGAQGVSQHVELRIVRLEKLRFDTPAHTDRKTGYNNLL
jgi:hypothetical protein